MEGLFTNCVENEFFKDFQDTSESSDDNTNVVNAPREPIVVNQDPDSNGVHVDLAKIEAIKNWAAPTTPTEKNKPYVWGDDEEEAFQTLKRKLCSAPILSLPEGNEDFVVYCDASLKGFRAVLMQREK
ncbi:putative reverse transcriptase domain-containing protein, partial [Tanacetum coccineum]